MSYNFILGLSLIILANGTQLFKILRVGHSGGVSLLGFCVTAISLSITMFVSESHEISLLSLIGLIMAVISAGVTFYYQRSSVCKDDKESLMALVVGVVFSFFMVTAVAQAIKSFKYSGPTISVSKTTWVIWSFFIANNLFMAQSYLVIYANVITLMLSLFVLMRCYVDFKDI